MFFYFISEAFLDNPNSPQQQTTPSIVSQQTTIRSTLIGTNADQETPATVPIVVTVVCAAVIVAGVIIMVVAGVYLYRRKSKLNSSE